MSQKLVLPRTSLCAVQLYPAGLARGALAEPDTSYALVPFRRGRECPPHQFMAGQQFVALVTHPEDAAWVIEGGSLRIRNDCISGFAYSDIGFSVFHTVASLLVGGEYAGRTILEEVGFSACARLAGSAAPMRHGLTLLFWDPRCKDSVSARWILDPPDSDQAILDVVPFQTIQVTTVAAGSVFDPKMPVLWRGDIDGAGHRVVFVPGDPDTLTVEVGHADAAGGTSWEKQSERPERAIKAFGAVVLEDPRWIRPEMTRDDALRMVFARTDL